MDQCFIDITVEFLAVAFHSILYCTSIYPKSVFETRKKYGLVVHRSIHPDINNYIELCLKAITQCLKSGQLSRIEFVVTDNEYKPIIKFIFDFSKLENFCHTTDPYLIQCEQNIRAFCLNLSGMSHQFGKVHENGSFSIFLHTTESTAVSLAVNPEIEDFPLVETISETNTSQIIPLKSFSITDYQLETYVEL